MVRDRNSKRSNRYIEDVNWKKLMNSIDRMYVAQTSENTREFKEALNDVYFEALNQRVRDA